jgi:uncharacterized membrane protein
MKKIVVLVFVLGLVFVSTGCGPSYRTQQGAVIGAALGAWAGQDLGHDTESTLIGAAVGGVAGAVIGDAVEQYDANNGYSSQSYSQARPPYQAPRRY